MLPYFKIKKKRKEIRTRKCQGCIYTEERPCEGLSASEVRRWPSASWGQSSEETKPADTWF